MFNFLKSTSARVVSLLLVGQVVVFYAYPKNEVIPQVRPLKEVPTNLAGWNMLNEYKIETEVADLLKADDTLSRAYLAPDGSSRATLFIAYFKTQRTGVAPHSPKVCLPGSGWTPTESSHFPIQVPGKADPIFVNRYIISKGREKSLVLYWYQTHTRVIASEYMAKVYTVVDAFRYRRSDTSLVRIVVPFVDDSHELPESLAVKFVQDFFGPLKSYLPS